MKENGVTLFDTVTSLATASLVALALGWFVGSSQSTFGLTMKSLGDHLAAATLETALRAGVEAISSSRLGFSVTSIESPNILLPNGSLHPITALRGISAPRPGSDLVSFLFLAPRYRALIGRVGLSGTAVELSACGLELRPAPSQFKSFLAVGVSGVVQLRGSFRATSSTCFEFSGEAVPGLVSKPADVLPCSLHALIPIAREYSLFIDSIGQLRLASHSGPEILENQPLASGYEMMRLTLVGQSAGISLAMKGSGGLETTRFIPISLRPRTPYDLIF